MRILLIEDDRQLCESLAFSLEKEGFTVDLCHDGEDGMYLMMEQAHDLVLLDGMLPGMSGTQALAAVRHAGVHTPVILVTALGELSDRVKGLDCGADDYMVKPFATEELMARIRSCLRRPHGYEEEAQRTTLTFGDLRYDARSKSLCRPETSFACTLSRREGDLLELFLRNPGRILPRSVLLSRVWGLDAEVEDGNLDNYIYFLRRRLKAAGSRLRLKAVRGVGYCLEDSHD